MRGGKPRRLKVSELLDGEREAILEHSGQDYRLRITATQRTPLGDVLDIERRLGRLRVGEVLVGERLAGDLQRSRRRSVEAKSSVAP